MVETYVLNEGTLVLEGVTLAQVVELVVEVLVDLAGSTVLDQQAAEDTELAHPLDLAVGNCQSQSFPTTDIPQKIFLQSSNPSKTSPCIVSSQSVPLLLSSGVGEETHLGIRASAVPFLLPKPRCLPMRRAAVSSRARAREWVVTGLRMIRPSEISLRTVARELALEISLTSLGSSQILRLPQPATALARRFWVRRLTLRKRAVLVHCVLRCVPFVRAVCGGWWVVYFVAVWDSRCGLCVCAVCCNTRGGLFVRAVQLCSAGSRAIGRYSHLACWLVLGWVFDGRLSLNSS